MSGGSSSRVRPAGIVALLCCVLWEPGCASSVVTRDGRFVHASRGYDIDPPPGEWVRIDVEGADLAFRGPDRATASLLSRCGRPVTETPILARHLLIGLCERRLLDEGPIELDGRPGWTQTYEARLEEARVRLKVVTLVEGDCVFDWVLVSSGDLATVEPSFDAWWGSFHLAEVEVEELDP